MRKLLCPFCNEIVEDDCTEVTFDCPHCQTTVDTRTALRNTQTYVSNIYKSASSYFENAYSYVEATKLYDEFLKFEPVNLDVLINREISLMKSNSLKENKFQELINHFESSDVILETTTYIRLGHFFDELMIATMFYQKEVINYAETATNKEQEIAYYNLLSLFKMYDFIFDNVALFKDEEYVDSFTVTKEEFMLNKEKLLVFLRKNQSITFDPTNIDEAVMYLNNNKIVFKDFDIKNYEEIEDFAIFKVMQNTLKNSYKVFAILIACTLIMVVGLILAFTLKDIQWLGYLIAGIGLGSAVLIYILFTKKRQKNLENLNK